MITLRERENAYTDILEIPEELDRIRDRMEDRDKKMKEIGIQ